VGALSYDRLARFAGIRTIDETVRRRWSARTLVSFCLDTTSASEVRRSGHSVFAPPFSAPRTSSVPLLFAQQVAGPLGGFQVADLLFSLSNPAACPVTDKGSALGASGTIQRARFLGHGLEVGRGLGVLGSLYRRSWAGSTGGPRLHSRPRAYQVLTKNSLKRKNPGLTTTGALAFSCSYGGGRRWYRTTDPLLVRQVLSP
jgi:hypothetical protein